MDEGVATIAAAALTLGSLAVGWLVRQVYGLRLEMDECKRRHDRAEEALADCQRHYQEHQEQIGRLRRLLAQHGHVQPAGE